MSRLKCPSCGGVFDRKAVVNYGSVGVTGAGVGARYNILVWPFTLRVFAECPVCKKKGWLWVLAPWSKG